MARKPIPESTQVAIFLKSRRRCCLCFGLNGHDVVKKGQLAHLDGDNTNFAEENLVFLCLEHHDEYDTVPRLTKKLREAEVKKWREDLYRHNANNLKESKKLYKRFSRHARSIIESLEQKADLNLGIHEEIQSLSVVASELGIETPIEVETIPYPEGIRPHNALLENRMTGRFAIRFPGGSSIRGEAAHSDGIELLRDSSDNAILALKQLLIHLEPDD